MSDAAKHEQLMGLFKPYTGYKVDDYYGVTMMTRKAGRTFSIQLQYGYNKHAQNSSSLVLSDIEQALTAYRVLMKYAVPEESSPVDLSFL